MKQKRKLAEFLSLVSEWRWDEFVRAELDMSYSTLESVIFSLVRACAMENLPAMKTALGRLDGKLATPVRIVMPKVYMIFPNAKEALPVLEVPQQKSESTEITILTEGELTATPTKGFRDTMDKMIDHPRELPKAIIEAQEQIEKHIRNQGRAPESVPKVKSVVVAHMLKMAQDRDMEAINEVFDQLDGKLVETVQVVGEDMYIMSFSEIAPAGAVRNEQGVFQIEAEQAQRMWHQKLAGSNQSPILEGNK